MQYAVQCAWNVIINCEFFRNAMKIFYQNYSHKKNEFIRLFNFYLILTWKMFKGNPKIKGGGQICPI